MIIVSHDGFNQNPSWRSIIVVPLSTSQAQARRGPTAVYLKGVEGLGKAGVGLCHQVTTLDRSKLTQQIGELSPEMLEQVEEGLKASMGME